MESKAGCFFVAHKLPHLPRLEERCRELCGSEVRRSQKNGGVN